MQPDFLQSYLASLPSIPGWFSANAGFLFMMYNQLIAEQGVSGDVLEIGTHLGKSGILVGALRRPGARFVAADFFDKARSGRERVFLDYMRHFHGTADFVEVRSGFSEELTPADLGKTFSFCHIDGSHDEEPVFRDMELCAEILLPGGLVALDDYFNPAYPGVGEAALRFAATYPRTFAPVAIGYNKVLLQKIPTPFDIELRFLQTFPYIPRRPAKLWKRSAQFFGNNLEPFFDVEASQPLRLVRNESLRLAATIRPAVPAVIAQSGDTTDLPVCIENSSPLTFQEEVNLSYHLLAEDSTVLAFDNPRTSLGPPLASGEDRSVTLQLIAPKEAGRYKLEIDLVWEGVAWFKDRGNQPPVVDLIVEAA